MDALVKGFRERIHLELPVVGIERDPAAVHLTTADGIVRSFDAVILACHSDQALQLLAAASPGEREILGSIRYQPNEVVLHTDAAGHLVRRAAPRHAEPDGRDRPRAGTRTLELRASGLRCSGDARAGTRR